MEEKDLSRRSFIKASVVGTIAAPLVGAGCQLTSQDTSTAGAAAALGSASTGAPAEGAPESAEPVNGMPYRLLGKTGAKVSLLGVGGYHIGVQASAEESVRIIRTAIDEGVNFLDNAWEYNQGRSEERMGLALQDGYRKKAFLMTKVCGRDAKTAATHIDDSLRRMKTDVIDLLQFHEINYDNDPDLVFAKEGAIHAVLKAREAG